MVEAIDKWHKTRTGYAVFGMAELALTYLLISLAIDSGNLLEYGLGIIILCGGVVNIIRVFRIKNNEHKKR
jgi:uncharacterized membrane protein HdeD (DUF308 family)